MSSSIPSPKFLLDENIKYALFKLLRDRNIDVKLVPKSASDKKIASISKTEQRILVTNDEDFIYYTTNQAFSVVWIRVPQEDTKSLLTSFEKMLKGMKDFSGKLVVLKEDGWDEFPLGEELKNQGEFRAVVWKRKSFKDF